MSEEELMIYDINNCVDYEEIYPLGNMKQYPIERDLFCKIFNNVFHLWDELEPYNPINTQDFMIFYDSDLETAYMLHKDSGILITWYKFCHLGRALECNKDISLKEYKIFANLLENQLKELKRM